MLGEKRVYFGVSVLIAVVMMFGFVLAQEDPQLDPFDATVGVGNAIPNIPPLKIFVEDVDNCAIPPCLGEVNPLGGAVNNAQLYFNVTDTNGPDDLPGAAGYAIVQSTAVGEISTVANLEVYFTRPTYPGQGEVFPLPDCVRGNVLGNEVEYVCNMPMQYYYEPHATWSVTVAAKDQSDSIATDSSYAFEHTSVISFDFSTSGIVWTLIDLGVSDQVADAQQGLTNRGNVNVIRGDITGQNLVPSPAGGDDMPVDAFGVAFNGVGTPAGSCCVADNPHFNCQGIGEDANELSAGVAVTIDGGNGDENLDLIYGDGAGGAPVADAEELFYCQWERLDTRGLTLTAASYVANGGNAWALDLFDF